MHILCAKFQLAICNSSRDTQAGVPIYIEIHTQGFFNAVVTSSAARAVSVCALIGTVVEIFKKYLALMLLDMFRSHCTQN